MRILIVEDNRDLNVLIAERLQKEGYVTDSCHDGAEALEYFDLGCYDGAILDIMLPKADGFEVLKRIREKKIYTPVLFLTALSDSANVVRGLDGGADDYLVKPFDFDVLSARLRAMLRKVVDVHDNCYHCGDLEIRESEHEAYRGGRLLDLTGREYNILLYLVRNQNMVLSRDQILSAVWNDEGEVLSNVVDVFIRYLRKKVDDPFDKKLIRTVRGVGYRISAEEGEG